MPSRAEARAVGPSAAVVVELRRVSKDYRSLRPLRVEQLTLRRGRSIALLGFDEAMAAVLTDLITGATVPDTGDVIVFGTPTAAISDGDAWLKLLDRLGLLSERSVLVDRFTAEQNLMLPITLDLEGAPEELRQRVRGLAAEVGLGADELQRPPGALPPLSRQRVRLARALALEPEVLLAEHPNAPLSADEAPVFAADLSRVIAARRLSSIVVTADPTFAAAVADEILTLQPATGVLKAVPGWRRWLGR
jgi:ABC-type transporter Mla maintaining outer membrane lipid asymmetry ATPase subunit MlaF